MNQYSIWDLAELMNVRKRLRNSLKRNWVNWIIHPRYWFDIKFRQSETNRLAAIEKLYAECFPYSQ